MNDILHNTQLIDELIAISKEAGEAILNVYNSDFDYKIKEDSSPLTKADEISHKIIVNSLNILTPNIPILSEEGTNISFETRSKWERYWLIDPLDGTKEFIKKNGEFTINIALIENNKPMLGVIYVPTDDVVYWGLKDIGSFKKIGNSKQEKIHVSKDINKPIRVLASRSHPSESLNLFFKKIGDHKIITKGSSLKLCLIASGEADIYPRFGPTSEWDIAAGQAILEYAGGYLLDTSQKPIHYNKKSSFINNNFIAFSNNKVGNLILDLI